MSKEFENLLKEAEKVKCDGYALRVTELHHLAEVCNNNFINGWCQFENSLYLEGAGTSCFLL